MPDTPIRDTVYFYKFNNYYNRIIRRYDTLEDYGTPLATQENCNFVHGDGVNSEFTFNKASNIADTPDYVIVKDYKNKLSRWFVTNSFKTRDRQDKLTLRRDLISDFYGDIVEYSPCLIRKGYVPQTSPFIFNDEGVQYNKKKETEILIKDRSNCSYIIGFISNTDFDSSDAEVHGTIKDDNYNYVYADLNDFPYKNYVEGAGNTHSNSAKIIKDNNANSNIYFSLKFTGYPLLSTNAYNGEMIFNMSNGFKKPTFYTSNYSTTVYDGLYTQSGSDNDIIVKCSLQNASQYPYPVDTAKYLLNNNYPPKLLTKINPTTIINIAKPCFNLNENIYDEISAYNGKRIKIGNIVYNVTLKANTEVNQVISYNQYDPAISSVFDSLRTYFTTNRPSSAQMSGTGYTIDYNNGDVSPQQSQIKIMATTVSYYLEFTTAESDIKTTIQKATDRTHLTSQPYDMFMLINEDNVPYKVGVTDYVSNHEVNINMAQAICQASGNGAFDIQIVPFNPMQGTILDDDTLNFYGFDVHAITNSNDDVVGHYIMCNSSDLKLKLEKDELKFNPENYKEDYNLKQYRLCSPNQETMFEFSPAMNEGIETWEISANYRPYASYIKVQPTWKGLYGNATYNNLTDFRGLVYNSSLCVTQLSEAWATYISSNKNYQQLFDNQVGTLTKTQDIQLKAMEDTLGLRSYTGMPIGSILRVIGGSKDIDMTRELNNLAIQKMETDFKYQMDNIKSMPTTIKKLTNITEDTRIFPFIEVYSATPDEVDSFRYKMKYTGYTIMTTGKIIDYCKDNEETFIQADLIRLDLSRSEESADNHIANEIASELAKGIYITKEVE